MGLFTFKSASLALLFSAVACAQTAATQQPVAATVTVKLISEAGAKQVLQAAEHAAEELHAPCAIAIVDRSGNLVAFLKMDGVRDGSPDLAIGKARTSALLRRPTAEVESNVNNGRTAFVTAGLMTLRGGVPLMAGKEFVGAIGIAGENKDNDVLIAQAASAAFATEAAASDAPRK